jgi:hypothetical protein
VQKGEIKDRIRQSLAVYEEALEQHEDSQEKADQEEIFHKCFQLLTQLPQLAPGCPRFILSQLLRILQLGQDRCVLVSSC